MAVAQDVVLVQGSRALGNRERERERESLLNPPPGSTDPTASPCLLVSYRPLAVLASRGLAACKTLGFPSKLVVSPAKDCQTPSAIKLIRREAKVAATARFGRARVQIAELDAVEP